MSLRARKSTTHPNRADHCCPNQNRRVVHADESPFVDREYEPPSPPFQSEDAILPVQVPEPVHWSQGVARRMRRPEVWHFVAVAVAVAVAAAVE